MGFVYKGQDRRYNYLKVEYIVETMLRNKGFTPYGRLKNYDEQKRLVEVIAKYILQKQQVSNIGGVVKPIEQISISTEYFEPDQSEESRLAQYLTGHSYMNEVELADAILESQRLIIKETGLPEPELRRTDPQAYLNKVLEVAEKHNIPIRPSSEVPEQISCSIWKKDFLR